jgi:hypothetical protein
MLIPYAGTDIKGGAVEVLRRYAVIGALVVVVFIR